MAKTPDTCSLFCSCTNSSAVAQTALHASLQVALELGSYIGYSAIVTARKLPAGGRLYGIEYNPINARVARAMIDHAGLSDKVEIIEGTLETSIPVSNLSQSGHLSQSGGH